MEKKVTFIHCLPSPVGQALLPGVLMPHTCWLVPVLEKISKFTQVSHERWQRARDASVVVGDSWLLQQCLEWQVSQGDGKWVKEASNPSQRRVTLAQSLKEKHLLGEDFPSKSSKGMKPVSWLSQQTPLRGDSRANLLKPPLDNMEINICEMRGAWVA